MKLNLRTILFILIGLCAFVSGMKQLREPDIWWQLLSGRWMLEHGAVTHKDVFSYTMAGNPWINVKWLYEIIIALLEKLLGPEGVLLLQAAINVLIVWLLYRTVTAFKNLWNKEIPVFAIVLSLLCFLAIDEYRMAGRPEMVSHLMAALYLYLLWKNPGLDLKKVWWFIPLQCLWANMHEGYPVGIVMLGTVTAGGTLSYFIAKDRQSLRYALNGAILLAASALVILLNPNGIILWKQPFEIYRQVWANKYTTELFSFRDAQYWTVQAKWHIAILVLVLLYWVIQVATTIRNKQTRLFFTPLITAYLLLIPAFAYLSLTANRNIPFSQIVLFPSIPVALLWLLQVTRIGSLGIVAKLSKQATLIGIAIALLFYVSIVSNSFYKYTNSVNKYGIHVNMLHNPTGAAAFIKQHNIKGTAFSDYFISSYLLWDLYPAFKSYIDLRDLDVFPVTFFDDYFSLYEKPEKFAGLDKKYNFNYVVLSASQLQSIQMNLYWEKGYNLIYLDPVSAIFLKQNAANAALNANPALQKMYNWPTAIEDPAWAEGLTKLLNPAVSYADEDESRQPIHAARYYNMIKNYSVAVKMLQPQMPSFEDDAEAYAALGTIYRQYGDVLTNPVDKKMKLDSALMYLEQALTIAPGYGPAISSLGILNIMQGNYAEAANHLEQFLKNDKSDDYMYFLYGFSNRMLWKNSGEEVYCKKVINAMRSSLRLNPRNGKANLYMAEAYNAIGEKDKAKNELQKAMASRNKWVKEEEATLNELKAQLGIK